ncbi:hypothetical protein [Salinibacter ruber]|uniref:Uncharacterized protein n=1 Tax=Salinibacter ruber TaxID=146919 RepID=A0A9X2U505_9BACT|nr:hypothetical protein [Salinibacter ruber]MCS3860102.1 hypothetical protein [Salinibacter ruber]MCS3866930.1 hypothetical protein [Salinibacter ruber]MCS4152665.1 hypothetical protein [Salinibacter ruber]MCS4178394.1 hypothetical protein [Salinibacter ruber]
MSHSDAEASNDIACVIGGVLIPESFPRRVSYDPPPAQFSSGAIPDTVDGMVTF